MSRLVGTHSSSLLLADKHALDEPSPWICRYGGLIPMGGEVLDMACGYGRHARWLVEQGYRVEAVDRDTQALAHLQNIANLNAVAADLENDPWPFPGRHFDGIIVSRYLHRPLLPLLVDSLNFQGVLIYETFMIGNERFGKPTNPNFLLKPNELLEVFTPRLKIVAFEQGPILEPKPAEIQRLCAIKN